MLNFDNQIKTMCTKVERKLNVLQRLSKFLSEDSQDTKPFIRSHFNYYTLIRHFCSKANTEKLEKKNSQHSVLRIFLMIMSQVMRVFS